MIAAIAAWPYLRQAFQWVRERWRDLNLVVRAREFMANTVLPAVREAAQRVGDALVRAADWLLEKLGAVAAGVQSITGRLTGGISAPLGRVIGFLSIQFRRLVEWARGGLRYVATNARSLFRRLIEFIQPIITVLRQLMLAVVNPGAIPGILLGTLWRVVPTCLKGPIVNFILDLLLRFLRIIPPLPQLGILWPFIRAAMLGFLERVRSFATERKVNVSNKIARIISGESFGFIIGYLRGLVLGLWDGIVGPFLAIRDLFRLPEMIRNFLRSLGVQLCDFLSAIRCFMSTLSAGAIGAFDSLMEAAGDLLDNPGRIIDLIRCAIQGVLSAVEGVGTAIANRMMALFEGPEDRIGESLGRLVGSALLDVVLAYFTAGSSAALTVIRRIASVLRTVGRNLMRVVRMVRSLIPRFLGFIRRIGGMFQRAGSRAGGLLSRIGGFFRRIANWFGRLLRRVGRRFGRGRGPRDRSRRGDIGIWLRFRAAVRNFASRYGRAGVARLRLRQEFGRLRRRRPYSRVVARTRMARAVDTVRGEGKWSIRAKRKGWRFRLREIATAWMDRDTRWRAGREAIRRRLRRISEREMRRNPLARIIRPFEQRYNYNSLRVDPDEREGDWNIMGSMSPDGLVAEAPNSEWPKGTRDDPIPIKWFKSEDDYPTIDSNRPTQGVRLPAIGSRRARRLEVRGVNFHLENRVLTTRGERPAENKKTRIRGHLEVLSHLSSDDSRRRPVAEGSTEIAPSTPSQKFCIHYW